MSYMEEQLGKNVRKRVKFWAVYFLFVVVLFMASSDFYLDMGLALIGMSILGIVDEKVKEGYWFRFSDLKGRKYTHEKLIVWSFIVGVLTLVFGLLFG